MREAITFPTSLPLPFVSTQLNTMNRIDFHQNRMPEETSSLSLKTKKNTKQKLMTCIAIELKISFLHNFIFVLYHNSDMPIIFINWSRTNVLKANTTPPPPLPSAIVGY